MLHCYSHWRLVVEMPLMVSVPVVVLVVMTVVVVAVIIVLKVEGGCGDVDGYEMYR